VAHRNWAGNYVYRAGQVHEPRTLEQAQQIISRAPRVHILGSRHSFTSIADSAELVSLSALPRVWEIAADRRAVRVAGSVRYGQLAQDLAAAGLALANLASLPHISVAGAVQTATHGSGAGNRNLAGSVVAMHLLRTDGEIISVARGDPDFPGVVVGLGALGAVISLTLEVEPAYEVRQWVYEGLAWPVLAERLEEIMACGYSVSAFTLWGDDIHQLWVKRRADAPEAPPSLFGAASAGANRHPIPGLDPQNCTPQLGEIGPWFDRLPHFRMGFTPSSGAEIQSEFLVPRAQAVGAIEAVRGLAHLIRPLLQVSEIRTVASDGLWMSPQYDSDMVGIHFTWKRRQHEVERVLARIESALVPFGSRPHWGKLFLAEAADLRPLYPRLPDFRALQARLDPRGAFRNPWLERHVLAG
jgi:alditol oxidase